MSKEHDTYQGERADTKHMPALSLATLLLADDAL